MNDRQKTLIANTPVFRQLCVSGGCFRTLFFNQPWHGERLVGGPGPYSLWTREAKPYYVGMSTCNMRSRLSSCFEKARQNQVEVWSYLVPFGQSDLPFLELYERCAIRQLKPQANLTTYWTDDGVYWFWRIIAEKVVAEHPELGQLADNSRKMQKPHCEPWEALETILCRRNEQVMSLPQPERLPNARARWPRKCPTHNAGRVEWPSLKRDT